MKAELLYIEEPQMMFGNSQKATDPHDGLILFGPHQPLFPYHVKAGVVCTSNGLKHYKKFVEQINKPIFSKNNVYGKEKSNEVQRPSFPGFEAVFDISWPSQPEIIKIIDEKVIRELISKEKVKRVRTAKLVDYYLKQVISVRDNEDIDINIWFIIVPNIIHDYCKPKSPGREIGKGTREFISLSEQGQQSFFDDSSYVETVQKLIDTSSDFHHVIKANLLKEKVMIPAQLMLESTLQFREKERFTKLSDDMKAHLAWTQCSTLFYKLGNLPWKLSDIRDDVCYLGLIFKRNDQKSNENNICSAAQMFLKDGDGAVFRGNRGRFYSEEKHEYHLDHKAALKLLGLALDDYYTNLERYPKELFIHGRVHFSNEEWDGFEQAVHERNARTKLVGIVIQDTRITYRRLIKLFRDVDNERCEFGVLRGIAIKIDDQSGYLFSRGFIPRLNSTNHKEIANPLYIEISKGTCQLEQVLKDVLALTKLNYNACLYGDGLPVTLRFSQTIGDILTATENWEVDMRQFKYYI